MPRRVIGAVEKEYRAWIRGLGELGPRQRATAAQIYALAEQIDSAKGSGEPLSAVAAVSREVRQLAAELRDAKVETGAPAVEKPRDSVDEVKARRERRRSGLDAS